MLTYTNSFEHVEKLVSYSSYGMQNGFGSIETESVDWKLKLVCFRQVKLSTANMGTLESIDS